MNTGPFIFAAIFCRWLMILVDTNKRLEKHFENIYENCKNALQNELTKENKIAKKAYTKGIEDALTLVKLHKTQSKNPGGTGSMPDESTQEQPASKKLYQMTWEEISETGLDNFNKNAIGQYSKEDLTEAAFKFESELIEYLGDINDVSFDAYTSLPPEKLVKIIMNSIADICRLKKNDSNCKASDKISFA